MKMAEKRDLKADLELCKKAPQIRESNGDWIVDDGEFDFYNKAREGWPHAIERVLELEKVDEFLWDNALEMFDEIEKLESLARELVAALQGVSGMLDYATGECRCGVCEYCNVQKRADKALAKAKEVLGDE